jgi:hypothetical protein
VGSEKAVAKLPPEESRLEVAMGVLGEPGIYKTVHWKGECGGELEVRTR